MTDNRPFHKGELEVQQLTGEQHIAARSGRMIQNVIPAGALQFVRQQSMIWIGVEDNEHFVRAFPLSGSPGFINPNNGELVEINFDQNISFPDEWLSLFEKEKSVACLAIELSSRKRLRINGIIRTIIKNQLQIAVQQAYPNCPKYIRKREILNKPENYRFDFVTSGTELNEAIKTIIAESDTAFVASAGPNGADVSHRGGSTGFIHCLSTNKIIMPDYEGNRLFNTLGNFKINPNGGLTVVNFNEGLYLQLTGKINLIFDGEYPDINTGGTNRYWEMKILRWRLFQVKPDFKWEHLEFSPHNPC